MENWSIFYVSHTGELYSIGPYLTESAAMSAARGAQMRVDDDGTGYFDIDDQHVYLIGPDHGVKELTVSDIEG